VGEEEEEAAAGSDEVAAEVDMDRGGPLAQADLGVMLGAEPRC
jgi:hypothetical protein